jgi:methionine aminopeptidase
MNKRHRAICDAVAAAIREGIKGVHVRDGERIKNVCAEITDEEGALKMADLMHESFVVKKGEMRRIYNLTEITAHGHGRIHSTERMMRKFANIRRSR